MMIIVMAISPRAYGILRPSVALVSTKTAAEPPTLTGHGAAIARMSRTTRPERSESGSPISTTRSQVASDVANCAVAGPAGATWTPWT